MNAQTYIAANGTAQALVVRGCVMFALSGSLAFEIGCFGGARVGQPGEVSV